MMHDQQKGDPGNDEGPGIYEVIEVPPLTTGEVLALRALLADSRKVFGNCPLAQRALQVV